MTMDVTVMVRMMIMIVIMMARMMIFFFFRNGLIHCFNGHQSTMTTLPASVYHPTKSGYQIYCSTTCEYCFVLYCNVDRSSV